MKTFNLPNSSIVAVHDIFNELPVFMKRATTLFIDPPYNQGLLSNFSHRPNVELSEANNVLFPQFAARLMDCVKQIDPDTLFLELGKEHLGWFLEECHKSFTYVTFYNSTYYKKQENKCYIIHATQIFKTRRYKQLEDMDEADVIKWITENHPFEVIGDLCMGTGLIGRRAYDNHKPFVGTELNPDRLQELIDYIQKKETSK